LWVVCRELADRFLIGDDARLCCDVITEDDPASGRRTAKIGRDPAPIPTAVPLILGDAVHALRASLDFTYAAVPAPTDQTMFPVVRHSRIPKPASSGPW
jgi:hypothetical protein